MKRYLKLRFVFGFCLALSLIFVHPFAVHADLNDLLISTGSNALMTMELDDSDYAVMPYSSLASVENTILWDSDLRIELLGVNASGSSETVVLTPANFTANQYGLTIKYSSINGYQINGFNIYLKNRNTDFLPPPGVYSFVADFASNFSHDYESVAFWTQKLINNAASESTWNWLDFTEQSGDLYVNPVVIDINNLTNALISVAYTEEVTDIDFVLKCNFTKTDLEPSFGTAGGSASGEDYDYDVSNSLSDLSSSVDTMTDEISGVTEAIQNLQGAMEPHYSNVLTQLHHITEQLHAFYDQVYNNIHLVELDILEGILAAIENMDLEVNVELGGLKQTIERVSSEIQANDNKLAAEQIANDEANTEEIKDAVEEHGNFIIDGLKGLFIPSDEFFKSYFDDLYEYFSDRFGFLSFPFDLLARFVNLVVNSSDVDCVLTLPSFEIMGEQLLYENSFNLTEFLEQNFGFLLSAIRMGTSIILIMSFVQLCGDKWKEVMNR